MDNQILAHTKYKCTYHIVFIVPYLYLLSSFVNTKEVFTIGASMAAASMVFLWIVAAVFYRMGKARKLAALGTAFLLAVPFTILINVILSKTIGEPIVDVWDMLSIFILLVMAFVFFIFDYAKRKNLIR